LALEGYVQHLYILSVIVIQGSVLFEPARCPAINMSFAFVLDTVQIHQTHLFIFCVEQRRERNTTHSAEVTAFTTLEEIKAEIFIARRTSYFVMIMSGRELSR
jgi:Ni,Fe-hydrogenase I cytochrome b subunit